MKKYILPFLMIANVGVAAEPKDTWKKAVDELVREVESIDPNIKSHVDEWKKIKQNLEQVPNEVESENAFKLSVQSILERWGGLYLRVLDPQDAQYWALKNEELALPRAWFSAKGSRWYVRYDEAQGPLRRGDAVTDAKFSPFAKDWQDKKEWNLTFKSNPMKEEAKKTIPVQRKTFGAWSLDMTQRSSQVAILGKKRMCFEKVWLFLSESVGKSLASKIASPNCQAMLIDLRDSFGEGIAAWPAVKKGVPVAVLVNAESREAAVALAASLKASSAAKIFGEPTGTDHLPSKVKTLQTMPMLLLASADGGRLMPDQPIKDSFMYSEGFDDVKEAAIAYLKKELGD